MTTDELPPANRGETETSVDVRAIGRDPVALESFYRAHVANVERFVARRMTSSHEVADVTAEVFIAAMGACGRFDETRGTPRSWLYGIAIRVIADTERRNARRFRAHSRHGGHRVLDDDAIARLEAQLDAEAATRALRSTLRELSGTDKALLELTALDGLSVADAAAAVGMNPATARARLHRLRQRFQRRSAADSAWPRATAADA